MVLQWNFVQDNIKLIFSMSNLNFIVDIKLQPNKIFAYFKSNKIDLLVTKNRSKEIAHLILILVAVLSNEGSGEPVHMCR